MPYGEELSSIPLVHVANIELHNAAVGDGDVGLLAKANLEVRISRKMSDFQRNKWTRMVSLYRCKILNSDARGTLVPARRIEADDLPSKNRKSKRAEIPRLLCSFVTLRPFREQDHPV